MSRCFFSILFATAVLVSGAETNELVQLQGRVAKVAGPGTNLVFKAESGRSYKLTRNPQTEALFLDTNLLSKVFLLRGKVDGKAIDVRKSLRTIKNSKVYDLFYYCDVCSITTSAPGLCACCREPTVLTEKPVEK